jgi:4-alpha-glucanotransferase
LSWSAPVRIEREDGTVLERVTSLPQGLPPGIHRIRSEDGSGDGWLISHPPRCPATPSRRAWGWSVQLYSLRSRDSWGIGDLADLRRLGEWSWSRGARFLQINPLMAAQPYPPLEASPYFPCSRRFLNPLYLRIEEVPGFAAAARDLEPLAAGGRALNALGHIDRDAIHRLKMSALEILWNHGGGGPEFERFAAEAGPGLRQFAIYCVLAENHGTDWRRWPAEFHHPESPAVALFAATHRRRVDFHAWVQWLLDEQLRMAAKAIPLVQDLPIGFDPAGADAWAWQELIAADAAVGAPPDEFNRAGQNWGLPPFIPHRLREAGYAPLRETLRAVLRHAGGLRVDHVMGLFRLYWIPRGSPPSAGAYVRYPHEEMLAVLALECGRAGAFVVGEDLGTVEPLVRESLPGWGILGSKVLWFESDPPSTFPEATLASLSTHDLPTLAGLWSGSDAEEQNSLGMPAMAESMQPILQRLKRMAGLNAKSDDREVARRVHRLLAESNSALVAASLEDALAVRRRPNLPGTTVERPNWSLPLPLALEDLVRDPGVEEVATVLDRRP